MADTLNMASIILFVMVGIFGVTAIVLFFTFRIPSVIGDLSGKNARKSIDKMRLNNERTGKKGYSPGAINLERGKRTEPIEISEQMVSLNDETGLLRENYQTNYEEEATGLLKETTGMLQSIDNETSYREEQNDKKILLSTTLRYIDDVMLVHTDEVI